LVYPSDNLSPSKPKTKASFQLRFEVVPVITAKLVAVQVFNAKCVHGFSNDES
jgi:hypothetical protein